MQIYIHRDGQQFGPYALADAQGYLADGQLAADDLAWHEGAADWIPLAQVPGIVPAAAAPAPRPARVPPRRTVSADDAIPEAAAVTAGDPALAKLDRVQQSRGTASPETALAKLNRSLPAVGTGSPDNALGRLERNLASIAENSERIRRGSSRGNRGSTHWQRTIGIRNMVIGGLFCLGGAALTFFSYEAASSSAHGGTYIITWGAILFGAIRFIKGAMLFFQG